MIIYILKGHKCLSQLCMDNVHTIVEDLQKVSNNYHHANMPVKLITPYTPILYSKTGVYRVYIFSYSCAKT